MAYELQQRQIDRQNLIAQALRDSGNIPNSRVTQNAGGFVTPISKFETITKLLEQGAGAYAGYKTGQSEDALAKQKDTDKQAMISGLMDNLAGPSQMAVPKDQTAAPIGATTNFDPNSSDAGVPQPQQPSQAGAAPVEQNQRRAAMAGLLRGDPSDGLIQGLQGAALKKFEPKPDYTLGEDQRRISGDTSAVIAQGAPKVYKPAADDKALVDIVNPNKPGDYNTIERQHFHEGVDKQYHKPNVNDVPVNADDMQVAVQYAVTHDNQAPNWVGRSPGRQAAFAHALHEHYVATGDDAGAAQANAMMNKADQSSLTNVTKLADNIDRAKNLLDTNLADLQKAYDKTPNADSEWGNKVLRYWQTGTGDPSLKPVVSFLQASEKEYAKLQVNSFGNAMTSDAANAAARTVINENFTRGGMKAVIEALSKEGENSATTIHQTKSDILDRINSRRPKMPGATPSAVTPPAAAAPKKDLPATNAAGWALHKDKDGNQAYVSPDGKQFEEVK